MKSFRSSLAVTNYMNTLKAKSTEDPTSLCSLLPRKVSQSTNIRLGNELEAIFNAYVCDNKCSATDIRPVKVKKGERQKDFLVQLENPTVILYAEFKSNINLDTEKRKATREKVLAVADELETAYPNTRILSYLVSLRYLQLADIPASLVSSYHDVDLIGINDLFTNILRHPMEELSSYPAYSAFLTDIVDRLEPSSS